MGSDVKRDAHALVQNAGDADHIAHHAVDDHMRTNWIDTVRLRKIGVTVADVRIQTDGAERGVNQVAIHKDLALPPRSARVAKNVREVSASPWR